MNYLSKNLLTISATISGEPIYIFTSTELYSKGEALNFANHFYFPLDT